MRIAILLAFLVFNFPVVYAQDKAPPKLTVFIDCEGSGCDDAYTRAEIKIVDFVRDRKDADVHILVSSRTTGGGAEQYKLIFYGQRIYNFYQDTLVFTAKPTATKAEKREQLVRYMKTGLVPLLNKTPYINAFDVDMKKETGKSVQATTYDEWDYVVFNLGAEGEYSADQNYTSATVSANASVNRTTEKARFALGGYMSRYFSVYKYEDLTGIKKYEVNNKDWGISQYTVASLGPHLGIGYIAKYSGNTFQNFKERFYFNPAIELNLFKYKDIHSRSIILRYGGDFTYFHYIDTTIYNKKKENLYGHEASLSISFNQKWGSFSSAAYYRSYFTDLDLNSMGAKISFSVRLFGGLSFYASANGSIIHDQVYLPKGGATERDVLIRRRQLETSFDYYTSAGLNYRFGSKLNNFINPRLGGYRGF